MKKIIQVETLNQEDLNADLQATKEQVKELRLTPEQLRHIVEEGIGQAVNDTERIVDRVSYQFFINPANMEPVVKYRGEAAFISGVSSAALASVIGNFYLQKNINGAKQSRRQFLLGAVLPVLAGTLGSAAGVGAQELHWRTEIVKKARTEMKADLREYAKELRNDNAFIRALGTVKSRTSIESYRKIWGRITNLKEGRVDIKLLTTAASSLFADSFWIFLRNKYMLSYPEV